MVEKRIQIIDEVRLSPDITVFKGGTDSHDVLVVVAD